MNQNNTETVVKEFLELWQKQCAYMARDGDAATQALELFRQMQEAYIDAIGSGLGNVKNAKSFTASDIFRHTGNEFIKLAKSYAELESRIARLESCFTEGMAGIATKTAAKRSKGTRRRAKKTSR